MQAEEATQSELSPSWRLLETEGLAEVEAGVEGGVVALIESEVEALVEAVAKLITVKQLSLARRLIEGSLVKAYFHCLREWKTLSFETH